MMSGKRGGPRKPRLNAVAPGPDTKRCSWCDAHYPATLEFFGPAPKIKSGLHSHCRNCVRDRKRKNYHQRGGKEQARKYQQSRSGKYLSYRNGAKQRGLPWELSRAAFNRYWGKPCHYCGAEILTVGIDRVDSAKGYTARNVVSCCTDCNVAKMQRSASDYIAHCKRVAEHNKAAPQKPKRKRTRKRRTKPRQETLW